MPRGWLEGSLALGVNRWRTFWKIAVRTARPALVAGTVLATARALGEAVMLAWSRAALAFAPNPLDGLIFFVEPSRRLAATILTNTDELSSPPMKHTLFAIAAVLLFSAAMLSLVGWAAKQPMKQVRGATHERRRAQPPSDAAGAAGSGVRRRSRPPPGGSSDRIGLGIRLGCSGCCSARSPRRS